MFPYKMLITIYNLAGKKLETIICQSPSEALWRYEMIDGIKTLDLTQELQSFFDSGAMKETQEHTLFCSYLKFGEMQQERANFIVVFERCH